MRRLFTSIEHINRALWSRVNNATYVNTDSLGIFRAITGIFLLYYYFSYTWISDLPQALFNPPILSIANLFDSFPSYYLLRIIDVGRLILLVAIIIGLKTRITSLIWLILTIIAASFQYSLGKIDHDGALLLAMVFVLSYSGWGKAFAVWPDTNSRYDSTAGSMAVFAVIICYGMFTAGMGKAMVWVDFDLQTSGFASWYYLGLYDLNRDRLLAEYVPMIPFHFYEILDYAAVLLELSPFLFILMGRKAWLFWLLTASLFHLGNVLLLNIPFANHVLVYLAFIDMSGLTQWLKQNKRIIYLALGTAGLMFLTHIYFLVSQRHYWGLNEVMKMDRTPFELYSALILWMVLTVVIGKIFLPAHKE
ncbi:hypothetical protein [Anditalea andensis]|uniref:HTTM domain-containing protein n=1 Tax=Anditalea andensis TaxID=1048983 RepID=A0A074LE56_9BACT|nr:hypothetical protein [Anditalea andensis]KEO72062.1 hypothetical protein EL17_19305 [Anditalea andensis]